MGFSLIVPIFNGLRTSSNTAQAKIEFEINGLKLENQKKELKNKIEIAYNNIKTARAVLTASYAAYDYQKEDFIISQKKYAEGVISSYDFLETKSNYIKAESELIQSKYDFLFKIKVLEYYK